MTPFPGLARRAVAEVERRATSGLDALVKLGTAALAGQVRAELRDEIRTGLRDEIRTELRDEIKDEVRHEVRHEVEGRVEERVAAELSARDRRIRRLEEAIAGQDTGLAELREQMRSLVSQLNERLLPTIDERMDETERDLARLATGLMRGDKSAAARESRLQAAEQRIGDLRARLARMEQRSALWRDLQATMAKLGDDVDGLRARLGDLPAPEAHHVTPLRETG